MSKSSVDLDKSIADLNDLTRRLETTRQPRRARPTPMNLSSAQPRTRPGSIQTTSTSARLKPSLDLNSRRVSSGGSSGGFARLSSFGNHENSQVQLAGLGQVDIDGVVYRNVKEADFIRDQAGFLGSGTSGTVIKMNFKKKDVAVKQIAKSDDPDEIKRLQMDLFVMMKSNCKSIVKYLGAVNSDVSVWIVMELMVTCFDKILRTLKSPIPVPVLGSLTVSVVQALHYLKEKHSTIHRDVKPSNILVDYQGRIKLCDFGISGRLVDSQARTRGAGCAAYLSPERIDPERGTYDVRADIWSLGLSMIELATAQFPYSNCHSDFEVCAKILQTEAPQLGPSFPQNIQDFVRKCCIKNVEERPKYASLMEHDFYKFHFSRRDRDRECLKWLRSHNLLPNSSATTTGLRTTQTGNAVHTPQPVSTATTTAAAFSVLPPSYYAQGRENWASFGGQTKNGETPFGPINSVSVKIENNKNQDLISW